MLINKFNFTSELAPEGNIMMFGSATLGNASVFVLFFLFAIGFSVIPSRIAKKQNRRLFIGIVFIAFLAYLYSINEQLALWFKNGQNAWNLIIHAQTGIHYFYRGLLILTLSF